MQAHEIEDVLAQIQTRHRDVNIMYSWRKEGFQWHPWEALDNTERAQIRGMEAILNPIMEELVNESLATSTALYYEPEVGKMRMTLDVYDIRRIVYGDSYPKVQAEIERRNEMRHRWGERCEGLDATFDRELGALVERHEEQLDGWRTTLFGRIDARLHKHGFGLRGTEHKEIWELWHRTTAG